MAIAPPDTSSIERREYKYLVDDATVQRLRAAIAPFCRLDRYAARQPDRCYLIHSLYFDTADLAFYRANERELIDRFKLRVRYYPSDDRGPVFFEVKRRINDVIAKTRVGIAREKWRQLLERPGEPLPALDGRQGAALERFLAIVFRYHARPITMVRYRRQPWVSEIDDYARVTIDDRIASQLRHDLSLDLDPRGWRNMDHPVAQHSLRSLHVVELKFTRAAPRWMMRIVQSLDLFRSSFSKYGTSIAAWYALPRRAAVNRRLLG